VRSPKLPAAHDSRRVYVPHGIRTPVLLKPSRAGSPLYEQPGGGRSATATRRHELATARAVAGGGCGSGAAPALLGSCRVSDDLIHGGLLESADEVNPKPGSARPSPARAPLGLRSS